MDQMEYVRRGLEKEFARKKRLNPSVSLRAYSRNLGIAPSTLSGIFTKKIMLSQKLLEKLSELVLTAEEQQEFKTLPRLSLSFLDVVESLEGPLKPNRLYQLKDSHRYVFRCDAVFASELNKLIESTLYKIGTLIETRAPGTDDQVFTVELGMISRQ